MSPYFCQNFHSQMRSKSILFIGILLLVIGILIKRIADHDVLGIALIIVGVLCKSLYILNKVNTGEYKPGKEIIFLVIGLLLFFLGLNYTKTEQVFINPFYLIISGITLKIAFIVSFIKKIRSGSCKQ